MPEADGVGEKIDDQFFASAHFGDHPDLEGKAFQIPWDWNDPSKDLRRAAAPVIKEYIRPKKSILEKVDRFYEEHLAGSNFIGVQIRGTDAVSTAESRAFRSGSLKPNAYITAVERLLIDSPGAKIFVATDAESSLEFMKEHFGERVVAYDSLRQGAGKAAGRGPQGGLLPAYISEDSNVAARNGEEAIIEYLLLCKCGTLVHNGASLARTVLLARPDIPHIRTNPPQPVRAHLHQFYLKVQRLLTGDGTELDPTGPPWKRFAPILQHWRSTAGDFFEYRRDPNRPAVAALLWCTDRIRRVLLRNPYVLVIAEHNNEYLRKRKKQHKKQ